MKRELHDEIELFQAAEGCEERIHESYAGFVSHGIEVKGS